MFKKSTDTPRPLTFYAGGSLARTLVSPEKAPASAGSEAACGSNLPESFATFDPGSWSWRTSQLSLDGELTVFSGTWPRAGTMRGGIVYQLPPSAPLTAVIGSTWSRGEYPNPTATEDGTSQNEGKIPHKCPTAGTPSLYTWARRWPTPRASEAQHAGRRRTGASAYGQTGLAEAANRNWPTATAGDAKSSGSRGKRGNAGNKANEGASLTDATVRDGRHDPTTCNHGGECKPTLNPRFVEWLMGFPIGWTDSER